MYFGIWWLQKKNPIHISLIDCLKLHICATTFTNTTIYRDAVLVQCILFCKIKDRIMSCIYLCSIYMAACLLNNSGWLTTLKAARDANNKNPAIVFKKHTVLISSVPK